MSSRKTEIALGLAGAIALSASMPSMASMPTAVAAIKTAPSADIIDVRWGWCRAVQRSLLELLRIVSPKSHTAGYSTTRLPISDSRLPECLTP